MNPRDAISKLNSVLGKMDEHLFEITDISENFFGEYVVSVKVNRMVKASYQSLKRIAEITGAKDILIERAEHDNLAELKILIPKN